MIINKDLKELYESLYQCDFKDLNKLWNDLISNKIYDDLNEVLMFHKDDKEEIESFCMDMRVRLAVPIFDYQNLYSEYQPNYSTKPYKNINKLNEETRLTFIKILTGMTKFSNTRQMYMNVVGVTYE